MFADRSLPDGLAYAKAKIREAQATMISTAGDAGDWQASIRVSEPRWSAEIIALMQARVAANRAHGKPLPHIRDRPQLNRPNPNGRSFTSNFSDDEGQRWNGLCFVEPSVEKRDQFLVTFRLEACGFRTENAGERGLLGSWHAGPSSGGTGLRLEAGFAFDLVLRLQPVVYVLPVFSGA